MTGLIRVALEMTAVAAAFYAGQEVGRKRERLFIERARKEIDRLHNGWPLCDACGEVITDEQENVGHECDLHAHCVAAEAVQG